MSSGSTGAGSARPSGPGTPASGASGSATPAGPAPATPVRARELGSEAVTRGVRVRVRPQFLPERSDPAARSFVFGYRIRITNEGPHRCKLLARHWVIVDAVGRREEVRGEGVVGYQPDLKPGEFFEYSSFCPLATNWGTMEGEYTMVLPDGETFAASIARFYLAAPADAGSAPALG